MKTTAKKIKSLAMEGNAISIEEFRQEIAKAEKGPFYKIDEGKKLLATWRKAKSSK
jgi:hypothetical protein